MQRRNVKRNKLIPVLVILLLGITLGYAYLNTTLNINGTTNISSANWNIYWDNIQFASNNVTDVTTPATIQTGLTEVTFNVNFKEPGDTYEFTVDAVNDGSIDAMIDTFSKGVYASNGTTEKTLPDYLEYTVTYSDGVEISQNHLLEAGKTETYKVRVHYKEDITASQLPSTNDNYMFKFSVTYAQADNTAINKPLPYVYTVNKYNSSTTTPKWNSVWLNQAFPASITQYNTPSEALTAIATASSKNLPYYLKHKLENGIVTESYVEFVVTPEMATANTGMVAGTYTLRGEKTDDKSSDYISPYYEANKEAIKTAFGYSTNPSRCYESGTGQSSHFRCSVSGLYADAIAYGYVIAYDYGSSGCSVDFDGSSNCYW